jgi:hypothetical protein
MPREWNLRSAAAESEPKPCGLYVEQWILLLDGIPGLLRKNSLASQRLSKPKPVGLASLSYIAHDAKKEWAIWSSWHIGAIVFIACFLRLTVLKKSSFNHCRPRSPKAPFVFAATSRRAGKKRGNQPIWLSTVMRYHIQPVVKRLGINKRVSWHTFRRTYSPLLQANREDVKVVQELLRHGSTKVTLDIYAQAQMPAKREAQRKVVQMVRPETAHAVPVGA